MTTDTAKWSGEGDFTQKVLEQLQQIPQISSLRVEDAPASRSDADYNFISNEIYIEFATTERHDAERKWGIIPVTRTVQVKTMTIGELESALAVTPDIGAPDYSDEGMMQYLRAERVVPPYQTRGYKIVELVRIYEAGVEPRR
jgi:hypothetical protein